MRLTNELLLAKRTWQLFGIGHRELVEMDSYDVELLKVALMIYG